MRSIGGVHLDVSGIRELHGEHDAEQSTGEQLFKMEALARDTKLCTGCARGMGITLVLMLKTLLPTLIPPLPNLPPTSPCRPQRFHEPATG